MNASRRVHLVTAAVVLLLHAPLLAHSVSISRGSLTVHPDGVTIDIEVSAEDFLHFFPVPGPQSVTPDYLNHSLDEYRTELLTGIHLYQLEGRRLPLQVVSAQWSSPPEAASLRKLTARYRLRADWGWPNSRLTIRQTLGTTLSSYRSQMVLDVRPPEGESIGTLTLTNGGNAEILSIAWPADASTGAQVRILPVRNRVHMEAVESQDALVLHIDVPLPVLDRVSPLPRREPDFLLNAELAACADQWLPEVTSAAYVSVDHATVPALSVEKQLVDVEGMGGGCTGSDGISLWSSALRVTMRYPLTPEWRELEIGWSTYNAAILLVEADLQFLEKTVSQILTSYTPRVRYARPAND